MLLHVFSCHRSDCKRSNCPQLKKQILHALTCCVDNCETCEGVKRLLEIHSESCLKKDCKVPSLLPSVRNQ
ncbi:uncharacterized protein [Blastocystis hominis]|uniref:TAZ-type domain-containing protein n=1 Tax=Blastocystis hominis TaxID=12968 RepID=D8M0W7_BLAHO|nr:uncharacterized protein [Blastocystis hominis]CBK21706.2 unnamed protein product [Blastocystis hominis]|eukprot:XP_012895754.1 uncharacterized protein [Blastocystis hominis]